MATYLLDTTVLVLWFRGHAATRNWLVDAHLRGDILGTCTVNVTEVYTRAHPHERDQWQAFFEAYEYWDVTAADAVAAGISRYALARRGFSAGFQDATIAAVARRVGATVVTDNVKDFELLGVPLLSPA